MEEGESMVPGVTVDVEPVPWWIYLAMVIVLLIVTYAARLLVLGYRQIRLGQVIPKETVDLIVNTKDKEIERRDKEIERLWQLYRVTDEARGELAKSAEAMTDALEEANEIIRREIEGTGADVRRRPDVSRP